MDHRLYRPGLRTAPALTFVTSQVVGREGGTPTNANVLYTQASADIGAETEDRFIVAAIGFVPIAFGLSTVSINGTQVRVLESLSANSSVFLAYGLVPFGQLLHFCMKFAGGTGGADPRIVVWKATGLSSPDPVDVQSSTTATATARTVTLKTCVGGIALAVAGNDVVAAQSCAWTGTQSPTERADAAGSAAFSAAEIASTNDDPANSITSTFAVSSLAGISLLAASWR